MVMPQYTRTPPVQTGQQGGGALGAVENVLKIGEQIDRTRDRVKKRKRRKDVFRILGQPGKINAARLREVAKIDPVLANEIGQLNKGLNDMEAAERKMALESYKNTIDIMGSIGATLKSVPLEQRQEKFVQMVQPLAQNEQLKGMAQTIVEQFQDGDFSDESLDVSMMRAVGHETHYNAHLAKLKRKEIRDAKELESTTKHERSLDIKDLESANKMEEEVGKQEGRIALEELEQKGTAKEERMKKERQESVERIKKKKNMPRDQKIAQLMKQVGPGLSYHAAAYIMDPKTVPTQEDDLGNKVPVDNKGNPLDLTPYTDWIHGKKKDKNAELPAGSPKLIGKYLRGGANRPQPGAAPGAPANRSPAVVGSSPAGELDVPF